MQQQLPSRGEPRAPTSRARFLPLCLLGFLMYLAYGCREIGAVLPLCVITSELVVRRRVTRVSLIPIAVFLVFAFGQSVLLDGDFTPPGVARGLDEFSAKHQSGGARSHLELIDSDPTAVAIRVRGYYWALQGYLPHRDSAAFGWVTAVLLNSAVVVACLGYVVSLRRGITALEVFLGGYVAVLLLFGAPTYKRYLLPLVPLMLYYLAVGYRQLLRSVSPRWAAGLAAGLLSITAVVYAHGIAAFEYDDLDYGIGHRDAAEMFGFVRDNTTEADLISFECPRIMSLLAGRTSIGYPRRDDFGVETLEEFFDASGVDYLVEYNRKTWIRPLPAGPPPTPRFREVFRNRHFAVYRRRAASGGDGPPG